MGSFMNDTVLWRRGNNDILAAGTNRVTNDRRFRVLHDESMLKIILWFTDFECVIFFFLFAFHPAPKGKTPTGGDVWVLLISDTKPSDSDLYVCEVGGMRGVLLRAW